MHSFHQSRGRIFFEVFCALAIAASFAGAWQQTGASALLAGAAVAALYGLVHLFDLRRPKSAVTVEPQRIDFETETEDELPGHQDHGLPLKVDDQSTTGHIPENAEIVAPAAPRARAPRKGGRRPKALKEAKVAKLASPEEPQVAELEAPAEAEIDVPAAHEEAMHYSPAPLFEPEPFARQRHAVFGRKAG
jgi:hypothetical protein